MATVSKYLLFNTLFFNTYHFIGITNIEDVPKDISLKYDFSNGWINSGLMVLNTNLETNLPLILPFFDGNLDWWSIYLFYLFYPHSIVFSYYNGKAMPHR